MSAEWYVKTAAGEFGPLASQQIREMAMSGRLAPTDGIRQKATDAWAPAGQVRGLVFPVSDAVPVSQAMPVVLPVKPPDGSEIPVAAFVFPTMPTPPPPPRRTTSPAETPDEWLEERYDFINVDGWKAEFKSTDWHKLFPFGTFLRDRPWTLLWVQFLAFAFGFPFLLIQYYGGKETSLLEAAWAFSLYFAILWAAFLHRCMRPDSLSKKRIVGTWLFTSFLGVMAVILITHIGSLLPGARDIVHASESASIVGRLMGFTLAVGLVEEAVKGFPVLWIAMRTRTPIRPISTAYLGVISGLSFGAAEAIVYSIQYAMGHAAAAISYGDYLIVQVLRFVSLPLLHAIWSGILGYFIGLAMVSRNTRRTILVVGLGLVASLHGVYNTFSNGWFGFFVAGFSLLLFVGYVRAESSSPRAAVVEGVAT